MTSEQNDRIASLLTACDEFVHAFGQDYPTEAENVQLFSQNLAAWSATNPVPEAI